MEDNAATLELSDEQNDADTGDIFESFEKSSGISAFAQKFVLYYLLV